MGITMYILIISGGIMLFLSIYLGVRDQYKSQEEISKRNYMLEQYYKSIRIGDIFIYKIGNISFKVVDKNFNTIKLEEIRFDGKTNIVRENIEDIISYYVFDGNINSYSIMF